jgi:TPP-dependent pyruvate/acetoin dehydrogenase alpha subunit
MNTLTLYKNLYLIRRSEEMIIKYYKEDDMKTPMHMSMGEEAIVVGIISALQKKDLVFGTYRSHALYLAKTEDTDGFFAELYGKATGTAHGKAGSMHLASPDHNLLLTSAVVGTTIPVALGAALSNKMQKKQQIVVSFFGEGALDEGVFWESLNFACLKELPILFVCEDNDLAIHSRAGDRHGYKSIERIVSQFNCHVVSDKTTDVFAINKLTSQILKKIKQTGKPGFLHLHYYRYLEHVGVEEDFHFKYRSRQEFLKWKKVDPILLARKYLLTKGVKENEIKVLENTIDRKVTSAIKKAKEAPYPTEAELFANIYG